MAAGLRQSNGPCQENCQTRYRGLANTIWFFAKKRPGVPDVAAVPALIRQVVRLGETAKPRHLRVVGVQLDIDSPTAQLRKYAGFLREVRKAMPAGLEISITGLLDWFRAGTSVTDVVEQVDEFVPQFYDIGPRGTPDDRSAVAATIDAGEWAPEFNRFGKRFRIGISTFGRARLLPSEGPAQAGNASVGMARIFGDLTPLDVAGNPGFGLQTSRNEAKELVLDYRAVREVRIGYSAFKPGDRIQFILPTPDDIRAAADSARRMGAHCAGVVFFRWPASSENLVMPPDEVLMAAGLAPARPRAVRLELVNGHCAAVSCVDVHLVNARGLSSETTRYRVHSSVDLEYFLPEERVPVRMAGAADLEVTFPPYAGPNDLLLGRAVTGTRAEFRVEQEP